MKFYLALILFCVICCDDIDDELYSRYCKGTCQRKLKLFLEQTATSQEFAECRKKCVEELDTAQTEWEEKKEEIKHKRQQQIDECRTFCESLKIEGEEEDGRKTPYSRCKENCAKPLPWKKPEPTPEPTPEPAPEEPEEPSPETTE